MDPDATLTMLRDGIDTDDPADFDRALTELLDLAGDGVLPITWRGEPYEPERQMRADGLLQASLLLATMDPDHPASEPLLNLDSWLAGRGFHPAWKN